MCCECFFKILNFLNSNLFQAILIIITAYITLAIYFHQNRQRRKEAAAIVYLQIEAINKNINDNMQYIDDNKFDTNGIWRALKLYEENSWVKYRQILYTQLSKTEIKILNEYYEYASIFNNQLDRLHKMVFSIYEEFYRERKMKSTLSEKEVPKIRTFGMHISTLNEYAHKIKEMYKKLPLDKLM